MLKFLSVGARQTIAQIVTEFSLPFLGATSWTLFNLLGATWSIKAVLSYFVSAFFFISWFLSQWFRIRKQQKVEGGLDSIQTKLQTTIKQLDDAAKDLTDHMSGGDSMCYLIPDFIPEKDTARLTLVHHGKHPLHNVGVNIADIAAPKPVTYEDIVRTKIGQFLGDVPPNAYYMSNIVLPFGSDYQGYNMTFYAMNGNFYQLLRARKINGKWLFATKVENERTPHFELIQDGYPRNEQGGIDW